MVHLAYVACDSCGAPACEPEDDARAARRAIPPGWERVIVAATGKRQDWCPACVQAKGPIAEEKQ